jgi:hypothetical protein
MSLNDFDQCFRSWTAAACSEWKWQEPDQEYFSRAYERLPEGLRALIAHGVASGLIIPHGRQFTLRGLAPKKGPYAWFSRHTQDKGPNPNWEYFVQVAEFVRLSDLAARSGLTITFEDQLMDLAVYDAQQLLVCVEVKERATQLQDLMKKLRAYESAVSLSAPDRGNDPLRKAKYLVRRRPLYFCGVAIGTRLEYSVRYPDGKAFELARDVIPWV